MRVRPVGDIAKALALGVGELPGHVGERHDVNARDLDDACVLPVVVDEHESLADLLEGLALDLVLLQQPSRCPLPSGADEGAQLAAQLARRPELECAESVDARPCHAAESITSSDSVPLPVGPARRPQAQ